jgi:RNA polymerase-binding transcription factor DksA
MDIEDREQFTDELDKAAHLTNVANEGAILLARRNMVPEQVQNADGTWPEPFCVDCGDEIPEGRLKLGRVRCVYCQEFKEKGR